MTWARRTAEVSAAHQLLPSLLPGDAVGAHALAVRGVLRSLGLRSEIFADIVHPELSGQAIDYRELPEHAPGSVLVYHVATASVLAELALAREEPLVVNHHNVTPSGYFRDWDEDLAGVMDLARAQLEMLAPRACLGIGDSSFNRRELDELGYRATAVVPIMARPGGDLQPSPEVLSRLRGENESSGGAWLFVGRFAPNKAQHDLLKAFAAYRELYDSTARLRLVGTPAVPSYAKAMEDYSAALGLGDCVEIATSVGHRELAAYYESASIVVSTSEHEGFWLPALEAWQHGLPLVAYGAGAVAETVGSGGVVLDDKSPASVAAAVHRVLSDLELRQALLAAGRRRLGELSAERSGRRLAEVLGPVVGGRSGGGGH